MRYQGGREGWPLNAVWGVKVAGTRPVAPGAANPSPWGQAAVFRRSGGNAGSPGPPSPFSTQAVFPRSLRDRFPCGRSENARGLFGGVLKRKETGTARSAPPSVLPDRWRRAMVHQTRFWIEARVGIPYLQQDRLIPVRGRGRRCGEKRVRELRNRDPSDPCRQAASLITGLSKGNPGMFFGGYNGNKTIAV